MYEWLCFQLFLEAVPLDILLHHELTTQILLMSLFSTKDTSQSKPGAQNMVQRRKITPVTLSELILTLFTTTACRRFVWTSCLSFRPSCHRLRSEYEDRSCRISRNGYSPYEEHLQNRSRQYLYDEADDADTGQLRDSEDDGDCQRISRISKPLFTT